MRNRQFMNPEIEAPGRVQIRQHEGGLVCSLEQSVPGDREDLQQLVRDTIADLARWTEAQGGLVGHIKAALQTASGTAFYSCTGGQVQVRNASEPGASLQFTAIVFFVDEQELKQRVERFADQLR